MPKRITVRLDDDVYDLLLRRAGSERKISETLNPLVRLGGAALPPQDVLARIAELREELQHLEDQITGRAVES